MEQPDPHYHAAKYPNLAHGTGQKWGAEVHQYTVR